MFLNSEAGSLPDLRNIPQLRAFGISGSRDTFKGHMNHKLGARYYILQSPQYGIWMIVHAFGGYWVLEGHWVLEALSLGLSTVEARKLEYDCPPTPKLTKEGKAPEFVPGHIPTFWSLLQTFMESVLSSPDLQVGSNDSKEPYVFPKEPYIFPEEP